MGWELVPGQEVRRQQITQAFTSHSKDCRLPLKSHGKGLSGSEQRSVPQEYGEQWGGLEKMWGPAELTGNQQGRREAGGLHEDSSSSKKGIHVTCGLQYHCKLFLSYKNTSDDIYFSVLPQLTEVLLGYASNFL